MMASLLSYTILFSVLYKPFTTAAATTTTYFLLYIIMWCAEVGYSLQRLPKENLGKISNSMYAFSTNFSNQSDLLSQKLAKENSQKKTQLCTYMLVGWGGLFQERNIFVGLQPLDNMSSHSNIASLRHSKLYRPLP